LGWPRKRRVEFSNRRALSICGIMSLNKEDIMYIFKIISEFLKNNGDIILNLSIFLSFILLYINIPKVISLIMKDKLDKEEKIKR